MAGFTRNKKLAFFFIAPQLTIIVIFFIWPAFLALKQSLFFQNAFGLHHQFAGLANFIDLFYDPTFYHAFWVTVILAFFVTLVTMTLGLLLAVLVQMRRRSQSFYKTLLFWPYAVAPAVAAILWRFLCQPTLGWISQALHHLGFDFNYLIYPYQALVVIILTASWQQLSYNFLFFFAALQAIPSALIDAAIIDGASAWRRFWQIVFPLLSPTSFFLLIVNLMYAFFDTFGIIDILTSGGPGNSTSTLIYKVYKDGFINMDSGSAAALSVILMLMVALLTFLQFNYVEKRVHYQ